MNIDIDLKEYKVILNFDNEEQFDEFIEMMDTKYSCKITEKDLEEKTK